MSDLIDSISLVSSFGGADTDTDAKQRCLGNTHVVLCLRASDVSPGAINTALLKRIAKLCAPFIAVFLWPGAEGSGDRMRAFQLGGRDGLSPVREIYRCGSGALAAAKVLADNNIGDAKAVRRHPLFSLGTQAGAIRVGKTDHQYFYQTPFLPAHASKQPMPWAKVINRKIHSVTLIGGEDQYCLVELMREKDVIQAQINGQLLCHSSRRALILTAKSQASRASRSPPVDYVMRYFAPQYSPTEDPATGSANAMLAGYWQNKLNRSKVRGLQCSAEGALFDIQRIGLEQRVFGCCRRVACPAETAARIRRCWSAG